MKINNTKELKDALRAGPYAWPGGYPCYFVASDCEPLCHTCVKQEFKLAVREMRHPSAFDMFRVIAQEVNYEDQDLYCSNCEKKIESAYGE